MGQGIRLDLLASVIADIDASEELQEIFGSPVSNKLGLVTEAQLKIVEGGFVDLDEKQKDKFLAELDRILKENTKEVKQ